MPRSFPSLKTADPQTQNSTRIVQSEYDDQLIHRRKSLVSLKSMTTREKTENYEKE